MASVYVDPKLRPRRHYIAASSFNTVLYTYTTSLNTSNFVRTGSLGPTTGAGTSNCPAGRILRETGSRLYPDANPGVSTLLVQVYDANSGLRGFIDPNAPQFAVFNSDKAIESVDGGDNNPTAVTRRGQPVFTLGDVIAGGDVRVAKHVQYSGATKTIATAASATVDFDFSAHPNYTFFYFGISGAGRTLTASAVPPAGTYVSIICVADGAYIVGFGTGITAADSSTLSTGTTQIINFISNGTNLLEVSRSGLLDAKLVGTAGAAQVPGGLDA